VTKHVLELLAGYDLAAATVLSVASSSSIGANSSFVVLVIAASSRATRVHFDNVVKLGQDKLHPLEKVAFAIERS